MNASRPGTDYASFASELLTAAAIGLSIPNEVTMEYIRQYYGVPAKRGGRVKYTGGQDGPRLGTIKSASGPHLRILLDGDKHPGHFHPTWKLEYLT